MRDSEMLWDKNMQFLLVLIVAFNLIPHTIDLPPWITAVTAAALTWKALTLLRGYARPNRLLLIFLTVIATAFVFFNYHTIFGQDAATALLILLASLKLLETNRYRDAMLITFISYFLLMAHLLNSQSLLSTMFMALDVLLITTLMFQLHKKDRRTSARAFRPVMKMLAMTLPVWVLLFLAFPRFSTGVWRLQAQAPTGTGFSETLEPGSVDKLIQSDELAFRVNFDASNNFRLSPESLYWRGAVLTQSEGLSWSRGHKLHLPMEQHATPDRSAHSPLAYQIFLEPNFRKLLFSLEYPREFNSVDPLVEKVILKKPGHVYEADREITTRMVYSGISTVSSPLEFLTDREDYLQVPNDISPRVRELAETLRQGVTTSEQASRKIMKYFDDKNFRYTHDPGRLAGSHDQLEQFLFQSKKGFCEHFAGSFATLMRLMGYPARVVIGFQGGKVNEFAQYMLVRSLDAHAWAEVWRDESEIPGAGRWVRMDPTQTVAPLRLLLGGDYNRVDQTTLAQGLSTEEIRRNLNGGLLNFRFKIAMAWDAVQMKWNSFLLLYDFNYQKGLLDRFFGLKDISRSIFFLWLGIGIMLLTAVLYWGIRRRALREDPVLIGWHKFCLRMEKAGLRRGANEGPDDFVRRALASDRDFSARTAGEIREIGELFIELRYGDLEKRNSHKRFKQFRQLVRGFSIRLNS